MEWEGDFRKKSFCFISVFILSDCFCTQEEPHSRVLPRSRWATGLPLLLLHCSCWWLGIFKIQQAFSLAGIVLEGSYDVLRDGDEDQCCQVLQSQNSLSIHHLCWKSAPWHHSNTSAQWPVGLNSTHDTVSTRNALGTGVLWEDLSWFWGFLMTCRQWIYWLTSQAFILCWN